MNFNPTTTTDDTSHIDHIKQLEDKIYDLENEIRKREAAHKTEKAILVQKVELMELKIKDLNTREDNLKKLHQTMISALGQNDTNTIPQELEIANEIHRKEIEELRIQHQELIKNLEKQLEQLTRENATFESKYSQLEEHYNKNESLLAEANKELIKLKEQLQVKSKKFDEDKNKLEQCLQGNYEAEISRLMNKIECMKTEHSHEIDELKGQSETALNDIKYIYEQEKAALEMRLDQTKNNMKSLELEKEKHRNMNLQEIQNNYLDEIQELNQQFDNYKKETSEELAATKKQRDEAVKRLSVLEKELNKMKHNVRNTQNIQDQSNKNLKNKLEKAKQLLDASEGTHDELKRFKKQVAQYRCQIANLEASERRLKNLLVEKENELEEDRIEFKRKLNTERKKAKEVQDILSQTKDEYDKKKSTILQEMIMKDEHISRLSKYLDQTKRELFVNSSQISSNHNRSVSPIPSAKTSCSVCGKSKFINNFIGDSNSFISRGPEFVTQANAEPLQMSSINPIASMTNMPLVGELQKKLRSAKSTVNLSNNNSTQMTTYRTSQISYKKNGDEYVDELSANNRNTTPNKYGLIALQNKAIHLEKVSRTELKLLKECQEIVDAASRIECKVCLELFGTDLFYDHIMSKSCEKKEHKHGRHGHKDEMRDFYLDDDLSAISANVQNNMMNASFDSADEQFKSKGNPNGMNPALHQELLSLREEKKGLEEKLKSTEDILSEMNGKIKTLKQQRDKVQVDLDRLAVELKHAKMKWALTEEKKAESELSLKTEIKFLINKLLKAKSKKSNASSNSNSQNQSLVKTDQTQTSQTSRMSQHRSSVSSKHHQNKTTEKNNNHGGKFNDTAGSRKSTSRQPSTSVNQKRSAGNPSLIPNKKTEKRYENDPDLLKCSTISMTRSKANFQNQGESQPHESQISASQLQSINRQEFQNISQISSSNAFPVNLTQASMNKENNATPIASLRKMQYLKEKEREKERGIYYSTAHEKPNEDHEGKNTHKQCKTPNGKTSENYNTLLSQKKNLFDKDLTTRSKMEEIDISARKSGLFNSKMNCLQTLNSIENRSQSPNAITKSLNHFVRNTPLRATPLQSNSQNNNSNFKQKENGQVGGRNEEELENILGIKADKKWVGAFLEGMDPEKDDDESIVFSPTEDMSNQQNRYLIHNIPLSLGKKNYNHLN